MSHFEYVSVATALIYALAIGRLLGGLAPAMEAGRRYWVHLIWVFVLLLVAVMAWWIMWRTSGVTWTPLKFLWALSLPAFVFVRASILLGNSNDPPVSYFDHYYEKRTLFFGVGLGVAIFIIFTPWIFQSRPWFAMAPVHPSAAGLLTISAIGLFSRSHGVHAVIAVFSLISATAAFFAIPVSTPVG